MSCNAVRASAFLLVLSLLSAVTSSVLGGEPAKKSPPPAASNDQDDLFGDGGTVTAKPSKAIKLQRPGAGKAKSDNGLKMRGGEKAILKALKQETSVNFAAVPLNDVLDYFSEKHHIPIYIDASGLKDAKVDANVPVTCKLFGISLRSALEIILDELQLKWTIYHEVLMITSPTRAESDDMMYTKYYDVTDLIVAHPDALILDNPLTAYNAMVSNPKIAASEILGCFGPTGSVSLTPAIGRAADGGNYYGPSANRGAVCGDFQPLKDAITSIVSQKSWLDNGGNGTIIDMPPRYLIVSQTREVHEKIEEILAKLRSRQRAVPEFQIDLQWLWLDAAHRNTLMKSDESADIARSTIDPSRLRQMADGVPRICARATCLNGTAAMLAAGDRRSSIVTAVPVVDNGIAAYTPVVSMPNVGVQAACQITLDDGTKFATLDVHAEITRWMPARTAVVGSNWTAEKASRAEAAKAAAGTSAKNDSSKGPDKTPPPMSREANGLRNGSNSCPIDLPVMPTQEFGTTLRVPLGKPIVVGSVTFAPAGDAGLKEAKENMVEVYLIATVNVVKKK